MLHIQKKQSVFFLVASLEVYLLNTKQTEGMFIVHEVKVKSQSLPCLSVTCKSEETSVKERKSGDKLFTSVIVT